MEPNANDILKGRDWIPVDLNYERGLLFQACPNFARTVKDSPFLDQRIIGLGDQKVAVLLTTAMQALKGTVPPDTRHVFHLSHVGSTFTAKLLQDLPELTVLREPGIFRRLAMEFAQLREGLTMYEPVLLQRLLVAVTAMWRLRCPGPMLVKHTSWNLPLGPHLMNALPDFRGLGLFTSLEDYLGHGIGSGGARHDSGAQVGNRLPLVNRLLEFEQIRASGLGPLELLVIVWLLEMNRLLGLKALSADFGLVDFDAVAGDREQFIEAVTQPLDLARTPRDRDVLMHSSAWGLSSKRNQAFTYADRRRKIDESLQQHGAEIRKVLKWVEGLCRRNPGIAGVLPYLRRSA